jgi:hypothetical protein
VVAVVAIVELVAEVAVQVVEPLDTKAVFVIPVQTFLEEQRHQAKEIMAVIELLAAEIEAVLVVVERV